MAFTRRKFIKAAGSGLGASALGDVDDGDELGGALCIGQRA